jgi:hypothetical protein
LWAWAHYDFHLNWQEFEELTPGMFLALCKRRNIAIKYDRFASALTASAVYNVNRHSTEDPVVQPFDFIRDEQQAAEQAELMKIRKFIQGAIGRVPFDTPREKLLEIRAKAIEQLKQQGRDDAEDLFNDVWPSLTPKEKKCQKSEA